MQTPATPQHFRPLEWWEIQQLERQRCISPDWSLLRIGQTDLRLISDTEFIGANTIGRLDSSETPGCGLHRVRLQDCTIGDNASIRNTGLIKGAVIGDGVEIDEVARIEFEPEALCGQGTSVCVLDESGSRPVIIYTGISAQSAALQARLPHLNDDIFFPQTEAHIETLTPGKLIGDKARILGCGLIFNTVIGREVTVEGVHSLRNGSIINNAAPGRGLAYAGPGVDAENFILEDGRIDSGAIVRNCYIGQGATLEKGFTAHDSLFFANSQLENGEACALFAGPYTVSMHKSSLLIGCQTSFMNAGSATNQSNHMYKLGPVHWGELERGVKTSSNSYLMLGARIGAFSLLMGDHKTHPDSSEFPFSYLFGVARGATVVVPAVMLRSCGLMRDEKKWPTRDRRLKRKLPLHDRVCFEVLNPATVSRIVTALNTIDMLLKREADDDLYLRYKGMKISRASLERAKKLYSLAICKYLDGKLGGTDLPVFDEETAEKLRERWIDLAGQLMPRSVLERALESESIAEREKILDEAYGRYLEMEKEWIVAAIPPDMLSDREAIKAGAIEFDKIVEDDRNSYRDELDAEQQMLQLISPPDPKHD